MKREREELLKKVDKYEKLYNKVKNEGKQQQMIYEQNHKNIQSKLHLKEKECEQIE